MKKGINKLKIRITALSLAAISTLSLAGCEKELAPKEEYDTISQSNDDGLLNGLIQEIEVPNNNFKLITEYTCDDNAKRQWRITSDKFLYIKVYTEGLDKDTVVYIDNIHIDTSIKSKYAVMDGILQDSMDDHVHSSQMIGFPISDNTYYYGVNAIEGCNQEFIQGSMYGINGYSSGSISSERVTEDDYINKYGVYGNKIQIVYDLLIKKKDEKDFSNVSVSKDFVVEVTKNDNAKTNDKNEKTKTYSK